MLPAALLFKKAHFFYLCHQSLSADSGSPAEHSVNSAFLPLQRSAKDFIWNSNFLFSLVWTSIISAKQQNTYTLLDFIYFVFYFLTCSIVRLKRHKTVCDTDTHNSNIFEWKRQQHLAGADSRTFLLLCNHSASNKKLTTCKAQDKQALSLHLYFTKYLKHVLQSIAMVLAALACWKKCIPCISFLKVPSLYCAVKLTCSF